MISRARYTEGFDMTRERAELIRSMRHDGYTWRMVAYEAHCQYGGKWSPESSQPAGRELCQRAAGILGDGEWV